jgi:hypothetical protein
MRRADAMLGDADETHSERCAFVCRFGYILFHAVKEYVCATVRDITGLHDVLQATYGWAAFDQRVFHTMGRLRLALADEFALVVPSAPIRTPRAVVAPFAIGTASVNLHKNTSGGTSGGTALPLPLPLPLPLSLPLPLPLPTPPTPSGPSRRPETRGALVHTSFEAALQPVEEYAVRLNEHQHKDMFHMRRDSVQAVIRLCLGASALPVGDVLQRTHLYEPLVMETMEQRLVAVYGVHPDFAALTAHVVQRYTQTGYVAAKIATLFAAGVPPETARGLSRYCADLDVSAQFHAVPLTAVLRDAQRAALRRKYRIHADDTTIDEVDDLSGVFFCLACMSLKAFVVDLRTDAKRRSGKLQCDFMGIPDVTHNHASNELLCRPCGTQSRLIRFRTVGVLLRVRTQMIIMCSSCAAMVQFTPRGCGSTAYECETCRDTRCRATQLAHVQTKVCAVPWCARAPHPAAQTHGVLVLRETTDPSRPPSDADRVGRVVVFCRQHQFTAGRALATTNKLEEVLAHISSVTVRRTQPRPHSSTAARGRRGIIPPYDLLRR